MPKKSCVLCLTAIITLVGGLAAAGPKLHTITQIILGAGLTGGGTGPKVGIGIAPGGIKGEMLDPTLRDSLRGAPGPAGPTGPQGPQGVPGPASEHPLFFHQQLTQRLRWTPSHEPTLFRQPLHLDAERLVDIDGQAAWGTSLYPPAGTYVDGQIVTAGAVQMDDTGATHRWHSRLKLPAGDHVIELRLLSGLQEVRWVEYTAPLSGDVPLTYLDVTVF
jgi:hypothetical protein